MTVPLTVEFESRSVSRVEADLVAAGFFEDERPMRGVAGLVDWRLCGLLSRLLEQGRLRGRLGEAILVSTGGRLRAPRVLLLGLGEQSVFRQRQRSLVKSLSGDFARRAERLGVRTLAVVAPGVAPADTPSHAPAVIEGVLETLQGDARGIRLLFMMPAVEVGRAIRALKARGPVVPRGLSYQLVRPSPSPKLDLPRGDEGRFRIPESSPLLHRY